MTDEEKYLRDRIGTRNPFRVPEGYFDNLASQIMEQLPEQPADRHVPTARHTTLLRRLRPMLAAAALLLVAVLSVTAYLNYQPNTTDEQQMAAVQETVATDSYFEEATDYAMLDNYDIYACLTNE